MTHLDRFPPRARRFSTLRSVFALMLREMATTYGRSPGGYLWAVIEPVAAIAVLAVAFQVVFHTPFLGTNFPLFFASGVLPFALATKISVNVARSLQFSKNLFEYPGVTWVDAVIARALLALLTDLATGIIIFAGLLWVYDLRVIWSFDSILLTIVLATGLGTGIGMLNCFFFTRAPIYERLYAIATRPLMIVSGVMFPYETLPPEIQTYLWFNPLIHVVGIMRRGIYATYDAPYVSVVYVGLCALTTLGAGCFLLKHHHRKLLNL